MRNSLSQFSFFNVYVLDNNGRMEERFYIFYVMHYFSIELGIQTLNMNDINIIISLSLFVVAGYYSILAIGYIPFLKQYFVWFRDYFGMD